MSDITSLTLTQTLAALDKKEFSKEELNKAYLDRIKRLNKNLNAYLYVNEDSQEVPAAIKDLIAISGMPQTNGSKILEGYTPVFDATVIKKLKDNGISFNGKVNLDEFAMGSSGENSAYGVTKNPWDITKVPGGSSSGSAVAVAADLATFALGTDTGGSIRQPASFCGVVGLKPSYGRVSRYGAQAMASSLDQIGPITKSVADARLVLEWISGPDGYDSNCHPRLDRGSRMTANDLDSRFRGNDSLVGVKVGIPKEYFGPPAGGGLDPEVEQVIKEAIKKLEELGAEIVEVTLPNTEYAIAAYYIIMASEVSANLARYTGIRYGKDRGQFGEEPKRRIMLGTFSLSTGYYDAYFTKAAKVRTLIKRDFEKAFKSCDVIVGPVSPTTAWNLGEKISDPLTMYLSDIYTVPPSLAGIPGLSVPCGFVNGLPVGLQILGKHMDEETILNVGEAYENATEWHKRKPDLSS
jgi:aspartyl-tRNA(Asn)/glutamyl-tRNA(Gln) amidotransferase subunit A